jgi:3',5'-cyclic AMP phosphodiesterase CpdA
VCAILIFGLIGGGIWYYKYVSLEHPTTTPLPQLRILNERVEVKAPGDKFTFVQMTDLHQQGEPLLNILKEAQKNHPLFMTNTGDMIKVGKANLWLDYIGDLQKALNKDLPFFHTPGNHDTKRNYFPRDLEFYKNYFGRPYYYVDVNNWRLIFLDSDSTELPSEQIKWLKGVLEDSKKNSKRLILFTHCPPFVDGFVRKYKYHTLKQGSTEELAQTIKGYDVAAIFAGHIHNTFNYKWNNIPVYVTCYCNDYYLVTVDKDSLKVEYKFIDPAKRENHPVWEKQP